MVRRFGAGGRKREVYGLYEDEDEDEAGVLGFMFGVWCFVGGKVKVEER